MKKIILIILIIIINNAVYPQRQVDIDPYIFLNNIKQKVFKVKRQQVFDDIYVDLNTQSYIKLGSFDTEKEEVFVEFEFQIYAGNFINRNTLEYLFMIKVSKDTFVHFFCHAENYGPTTMIYIFDSLYNQISEVTLRDSRTELIDIVDIDNDGLNEVIMKSSDTYTGGFFQAWLMIFNKYFSDPILEIVIEKDCEISGYVGESITLKSDYSIENGMLIFNSKLDYYVCLGINEDGSIDNRFYKTEYKKDIYKYLNRKFYHIKDKNNVDWNDSRLVY